MDEEILRICEDKGCIGIQLPTGPKCLAHAGEAEQDHALQLISKTGIITASGVPISKELLQRILDAAPHDENNHALLNSPTFDGATFTKATFEGVTFQGDAQFAAATFTGTTQFAGATFNGDALFGGVTFTGTTQFAGATFNGEAVFRGVKFTRARFCEVSLERITKSGGKTFLPFYWAAGATFNGPARFSGATFTGETMFSVVAFNGPARFAGATFTGDVRFDAAKFTAPAWFGQAKFKGASFDEATFIGDAVFSGVTFTGNASFEKTSFHSDVSFAEAMFDALARFAEARFEQARQFGPLQACSGLVLDDTQFMQPVQIEVSAISMYCRRSRFPGGVEFRLRWAMVMLDDTDLSAPSLVVCAPQLPPSARQELAKREAQISKARQQLGDPPGPISKRPLLLSLRRANVAGLGLSDVSAADCRFAYAHNLDKLRLESNVSFATAPSPLGRYGSEGRQVIAEERDWRTDRGRRGWEPPPWWPDPKLAGDRPELLDVGQIADLYRSLRKGREDIKDEPGAADFYYGEMEMRRRARPTTGSTTGTASRGRAERGLLTTYWLVSGYSLRAWRALACLAAVTILFAAAFHLVGFTKPPQPVSYWTSLLYAFRANLSLVDSNIQLSAWGQLLQGLLRLTGPVLLGLALLALRGRVKR